MGQVRISSLHHTALIKKKIIISSYREIQSGAVAKPYMRKCFLIYKVMRKYFPIYEEAVGHIWLCNCSTLNFLIYEENLIFFFISVYMVHNCMHQAGVKLLVVSYMICKRACSDFCCQLFGYFFASLHYLIKTLSSSYGQNKPHRSCGCRLIACGYKQVLQITMLDQCAYVCI